MYNSSVSPFRCMVSFYALWILSNIFFMCLSASAIPHLLFATLGVFPCVAAMFRKTWIRWYSPLLKPHIRHFHWYVSILNMDFPLNLHAPHLGIPKPWYSRCQRYCFLDSFDFYYMDLLYYSIVVSRAPHALRGFEAYPAAAISTHFHASEFPVVFSWGPFQFVFDERRNRLYCSIFKRIRWTIEDPALSLHIAQRR